MRVARAGLLPSLLSAALGLLLAAVAARAQGLSADGPRARKVDEFGQLHGCSGGARLDNFAVEMENEPGSTGYIVAHDVGDKLRGAAHAWGAYFQRYFTELRGLDESRFVLVDAADVSGDDLKMELWLVPLGAEPPTFKHRGKKESRPFNGKYVELAVFSDTVFYDTEGPEAGAFSDDMIYTAYAELLKKQLDSQGYLVVYSPPGAAPGYWHRAGTREQQKFAQREVAAGRLTVINGGTLPPKKKAAKGEDDNDGEEVYGTVELWVGAKDRPPVKHVEEDSTLTEALMLGGNSFMSEEKETADWMLNNLAEMMRADKRNVGCIVVYPGDGSGVPNGEGRAEEPAPDVFKIAEGWKAELLKKHGFDAQRVVILSGPQEDSAEGRLEVWAVPYGAALPDPFARTDESGGAVEEEQGDGGGAVQTPPPTGR
jgi:hypothetical protein